MTALLLVMLIVLSTLAVFLACALVRAGNPSPQKAAQEQRRRTEIVRRALEEKP